MLQEKDVETDVVDIIKDAIARRLKTQLAINEKKLFVATMNIVFFSKVANLYLVNLVSRCLKIRVGSYKRP
jgi:hypothetical protein